MIEKIKKWRINTCIFLFKKLPLKKNKIIFISNLGHAYTCNPKYLCEYLAENHGEKFDMVWVFDQVYGIQHDIPKICRYVEYFSIKYLYEILTAKFIVCNTRIPEHFRFEKRKNQIYIQTWHSSLRLKKIEGDIADRLKNQYIENAKKDSQKINYIISGCGVSTNTFKNSFWYNGEVLNIGTPRIDYLIKNNTKVMKDYFLKKNNLDTGFKYILYAPTFRKNNDFSAYDIDFEQLIRILDDKFGGNWKVLYKLHPNLMKYSDSLELPECCINATLFDDIQELLIASDLLITDYSSCMFDSMYLKKICILYVNDLEDYLVNNRSLYFDINKLPFVIAKSNSELSFQIKNFDLTKYVVNVELFMKDIESYEKGNACEQIYNSIWKERITNE